MITQKDKIYICSNCKNTFRVNYKPLAGEVVCCPYCHNDNIRTNNLVVVK